MIEIRRGECWGPSDDISAVEQSRGGPRKSDSPRVRAGGRDFFADLLATKWAPELAEPNMPSVLDDAVVLSNGPGALRHRVAVSQD